ncbi:hypothetical protein [Sphingomonas phyllosphaerae]|uniref:hypothetical protein n=1 Tax=Sphingomonas phyllosphaerae TaxID=257003 RepID=UPI000422591C|nr:hypothetical protein [Sphingomonas phyllosphaerae]
MTQEQKQSPAASARAIAESLVPPAMHGVEREERWDCVEKLTDPTIADADLRAHYLANGGVVGEPMQDALATACMIRQIDN